jgi:substrate import-associated zinc metallohydrolase lipoprotein
MKRRSNRIRSVFVTIVLLILSGCYPVEELDVPVRDQEDLLTNELDTYIDENFVAEYGMAVRYKYVDNYLSPGQRVAPVKLESVRPMLDFIEKYWVQPYLDVENGASFFEKHVPAEIVLLGGLIYVGSNVLLGVADAGTRITLLNVNTVDPDNQDFVLFQLGTIYHEFAHVIHQKYKLPTAFETIAASGYTSAGSWFTLTDEQALTRGFVSPYATSSPNEDFAETVAFYLFDPDFDENFTGDEINCTDPDCESRNEGRALIRSKVAAIADHYEKVTGINLEALRTACQAKITGG